MKTMLKTITLCALIPLSMHIFAATPPTTTVGVVVPVAVPAMTQIVNGFQDTLKKQAKTPVKVVVKNAEGDPNIERSIMTEFNDPSITMVAPIGTDAAQMAIASIQNKPIIGIAADHLKENAKKANNPNVTGVNSQTPPVKRLNLIHAIMPTVKKITVIYSTDARIYTQVNDIINAAKKDHITVQKLMVSQLSDLYTISQHIDENSQAIFILKDELIVSGMNTLAQQANQKHIPIIASDDGSVAKGAAFALGVSEYDTGVAAAKMVLKIINGAKPADLPVDAMHHYYLFVNKNALTAVNIKMTTVNGVAKKMGYSVKIVK